MNILKKYARKILKDELETLHNSINTQDKMLDSLRTTLETYKEENTGVRQENISYQNQLSVKEGEIINLSKALANVRAELFKKPRQEVQVSLRIPDHEFKRLKSMLQEMVVTGSSTDLQCAALVGQQRVLDLIEKEFVNG